jgi:hypothetical protein
MMCLAFALHRFIDAAESGRPRDLCGLALVFFAVSTRAWRRLAWCVVVLATAGLLASFYTFPLAFEWRYVSGERATAGMFHCSGHFVALVSLFEPYRRGNLVPLSIGTAAEVLSVLNLVAASVWFRRTSGPQRRLVGYALLLALASIALMNPIARPVWDVLPLLGRLQFPWRILSVLSVSLAIVCGAVLTWPRRIRAQRVVVLAAVAAAHRDDGEVATGVEARELRAAREAELREFPPRPPPSRCRAGLAEAAAVAAAARRVRASPGERPIGEHLCLEAGRVGVEAGQRVRDLVPGRLRRGEDVRENRNTGIAVQGPAREEDVPVGGVQRQVAVRISYCIIRYEG